MFRGAAKRLVGHIVARGRKFRSGKLRGTEKRNRGDEQKEANGCAAVAGAIRKAVKGYYLGAAEGRCYRAAGAQASTRMPFQNAT